MNRRTQPEILEGETLDNSPVLTVTELCRICSVSDERIRRLVDEGIVEPVGRAPSEWRFTRLSVRRVLFVERLSRDLDVNVAGAALALELTEELQALRERLRRLESPE